VLNALALGLMKQAGKSVSKPASSSKLASIFGADDDDDILGAKKQVKPEAKSNPIAPVENLQLDMSSPSVSISNAATTVNNPSTISRR
jgi:hypothetical protein